MGCVRRTLADPLHDQLDLTGIEAAGRVGGRHPLVFVERLDAGHQYALLWIARHDGCVTSQVPQRLVSNVQPNEFIVIRAVAAKAAAGQDRTNIAIEIHTFRRLGQPAGRREQRDSLEKRNTPIGSHSQ